MFKFIKKDKEKKEEEKQPPRKELGDLFAGMKVVVKKDKDDSQLGTPSKNLSQNKSELKDSSLIDPLPEEPVSNKFSFISKKLPP